MYPCKYKFTNKTYFPDTHKKNLKSNIFLAHFCFEVILDIRFIPAEVFVVVVVVVVVVFKVLI